MIVVVCNFGVLKKSLMLRWLKKQLIGDTKVFFIIIAVAVLVRSLIFQIYIVPSGSMNPTLKEGDIVFGTKYDYGYSRFSFPFGFAPIWGRLFPKEIKRGDVIVFRYPANNSTYYTKRVIAHEGDKLAIKMGVVYVNNKPYPQDNIGNEEYRDTRYKKRVETLFDGKKHYIYDTSFMEYLDNFGPVRIPKGHFFVMGDNRHNSQDSRFHDVGFVPNRNAVGKPRFIMLSVDMQSIKSFHLLKAIRWKRTFKVINKSI